MATPNRSLLQPEIIQLNDLGLGASNRNPFGAWIDSNHQALVTQALRYPDRVSASAAVDVEDLSFGRQRHVFVEKRVETDAPIGRDEEVEDKMPAPLHRS